LKSKQVTQSYIQDDVLIKDRFTVGRARYNGMKEEKNTSGCQERNYNHGLFPNAMPY